MDRYWQHIVNSTEQRVEDFLKNQVRDASRPDCGRMESGMVEGKPTIYLLTDCLCLYFCEQSRYYRDRELFRAIESGVSFVERWQREDGSLDFPSCNFYSAPDTAFCFRRLYGAWEILKMYGRTEEDQALQERYLHLMTNCVPILLHGGFHTPNHRWAVMSALLVLAELMESEGIDSETGERETDSEPGEREIDFETDGKRIGSATDGERIENAPVEKDFRFVTGTVNGRKSVSPAQLRARAAQYRDEGIDCDEDGEYAERSTGNYNAVVDKCLMQAYETTGDESLAAYVERNLSAMLFYIDGDGTVFTENSTRQDQGRKLYPDGYFYLYTWMAEKSGSAIFDAAAHKIIRDNMRRGDLAPDCMYIFMTHERMRRHVFRGCGYPKEYRKFFRGSEVLRVQNGDFGYSVRNRKAKFLFVKFGSLSLWVRIGEAYCDIRNFIPSQMKIVDKAAGLKTEDDIFREESVDKAAGLKTEDDIFREESVGKAASLKADDDIFREESVDKAAGLKAVTNLFRAESGDKESGLRPETNLSGRKIGHGKTDTRAEKCACSLEATAEGWYYAPFREKPDTADWWKMDHAKREKIITSSLKTKVAITELPDGLEITVKTEGLSGLPLRLEIGIPAGCVLEHDAFRLTAQAGQSLILKQGLLRVTDGGTRVEIGPGFGNHAFAGHYSGEAGNEDGFSIFLNDYTPCERRLRIRQV